MLKKVIRILTVVLAILLVGSCVVGGYLCSTALLPEEHGNDLEGDRLKIAERYPGVLDWYDSLHTAGVFRDTTILGEGDYRLHAVFAPAPDSARGTAVVVHGYTDNHLCFLNLVRMYRDTFGYNVMVPDLHYHGLSEGRAVQMGWFDRLDVERFAALANELWHNDFMVLHGVSMGAATVMMTSGDSLPPYIRAFVEDCGYTSVWDQFAHILRQSYHLPPFPLMNIASATARRRYGWDFKEASSVRQLAKGDRPMLFIHGDADDYVPYSHLERNYEAKTQGYKKKWVAKGSGHAMAYRDHPGEYEAVVGEFLSEVKAMQ